MMTNEIGDMKVRIQRIGINLTSIQNIVKIPNITKKFNYHTHYQYEV